MEKIGDERLAKRADAQKVKGNGREEEDRNCDEYCIQNDLERVGKKLIKL